MGTGGTISEERRAVAVILWICRYTATSPTISPTSAAFWAVARVRREIPLHRDGLDWDDLSEEHFILLFGAGQAT